MPRHASPCLAISRHISQLTSAHGEVVVTLRQGGKGGLLPTVDASGQEATLAVRRSLTSIPHPHPHLTPAPKPQPYTLPLNP